MLVEGFGGGSPSEAHGQEGEPLVESLQDMVSRQLIPPSRMTGMSSASRNCRA